MSSNLASRLERLERDNEQLQAAVQAVMRAGVRHMPEQWTCTGCGQMLGTLGPDGRLQIKMKDLYVRIGGSASVDVMCPKCATPNTVKHGGTEK